MEQLPSVWMLLNVLLHQAFMAALLQPPHKYKAGKAVLHFPLCFPQIQKSSHLCLLLLLFALEASRSPELVPAQWLRVTGTPLKFRIHRLAIASQQTSDSADKLCCPETLGVQHNPTSKKYLKDLKDLQV